MIPSALAALVLALAVLRTYRLLALDTILQPIRDRAVGATYPDGHVAFARPRLAEWLTCVWCSGLWYSAAWYVAWLLEPRATLYVAAPLALSAAAGIIQTLLPD